MFLTSIWVWVNTVLFPPVPFPSPTNSSLHVIGVGLSRTGTLSTRLALGKLLGGKIYHGFESDMDDKADFWLRAAENPDCVSAEDWREFLSGRGYTAGVGEPLALFYKEVGAAYPEAKFLLNTRDPHSWYRSMRTAIIKPRGYLERPPISWIFSLFSIERNKQLFHRVRALSAEKLGLNHSSWSAVYAGEEAAVQFFTSWQQLMIKTIPAEKLLVYNVKEGWEPLAKLVGAEVPDEPFPQINDGATISLIVIGGYYILVIVLPILLGVLLYAKSSRCRSAALRIFVVFCRKPLGALRLSGARNSQTKVRNNNNNNGGEAGKYDYVKYANMSV